jgi:hypothetical protein
MIAVEPSVLDHPASGAGAPRQLLAPSPVGNVGDAQRAVFTVQVPDTDRYCVELAERGITLLNGPMTRPWGPRTPPVDHPDGGMTASPR